MKMTVVGFWGCSCTDQVEACLFRHHQCDAFHGVFLIQNTGNGTVFQKICTILLLHKHCYTAFVINVGKGQQIQIPLEIIYEQDACTGYGYRSVSGD